MHVMSWDRDCVEYHSGLSDTMVERCQGAYDFTTGGHSDDEHRRTCLTRPAHGRTSDLLPPKSVEKYC